MDKLERLIIVNTLDYIDNKSPKLKAVIERDIAALAKKFNLHLRGRNSDELSSALRDFIKNDSGHINTLSKLKNSL